MDNKIPRLRLVENDVGPSKEPVPELSPQDAMLDDLRVLLSRISGGAIYERDDLKLISAALYDENHARARMKMKEARRRFPELRDFFNSPKNDATQTEE